MATITNVLCIAYLVTSIGSQIHYNGVVLRYTLHTSTQSSLICLQNLPMGNEGGTRRDN